MTRTTRITLCCMAGVFATLSIMGSGALAIGAPPRLAVVAEAESLQPAADLLTVMLSTNTGVVLVERAQLDKVLHEQSLAVASGQDLLKLGELLGAGGVLTLQYPDDLNRMEMVLTLVAVKPGVVLRQAHYEWPPRGLVGWCPLAVRQVEPLFPKLTLLAREALPVSILNLRASIRSPETEALERELTRLLYDRLVREPEVLVLERRRLRELAFEKDLIEPTDEPFWNGGFLLEGTIDKEGYSTTSVSISGRIVPPDKQHFTNLEITGARTNLTGIVNDLAARVLAAMKKDGGSAGWDPLAEADRYIDEARWALRWGLHREAQAACEAGWALGRQTKDVAELRVRVWSEGARDTAAAVADPDKRVMHYVRPLDPKAPIDFRATLLDCPPDEARLADLRRALEVYSQDFARFILPDARLDRTWFDLGVSLLEESSGWLRRYYFTAEARVGQEDRIEAVKRLTRDIAEELTRHPGYTQMDAGYVLARVKVKHSAFWVDTPEEGIAIYWGMIRSGEWGRFRTRFVELPAYQNLWLDGLRALTAGQIQVSAPEFPAGQLGVENPYLTGWRPKDRARVQSAWNQLVEQMCQDSNAVVAVEGRYLRCAACADEADFEAQLRELLDAMLRNRGALAAASSGTGLLGDTRLMIASRWSRLSVERQLGIKDRIWKTFEADFNGSPVPSAPAPAVRPPPVAIAPATDRPPAIRSPGMPMSEPEVDYLGTVSGKVLEIKRFWNIPQEGVDASTMGFAPRISNVAYREGKIWLWVCYTGQASDRLPQVFFEVDPRTLRSANREARFEPQERGQYLSPPPPDREFDIRDGVLYARIFNRLRTYTFADHEWKPAEAVLGDMARPTRLGNQLFFTTRESILQVDPAGSIRVLASTRRRPAVSKLDGMTDYGSPPPFLFETQNGVHVCIRGEIYAWSAKAGDWHLVSRLPGTGSGRVRVFDQGVLCLSVPPARPGGGQSTPTSRPQPTGAAVGLPPMSGTPGELWGMFGSRPDLQLLMRESSPAAADRSTGTNKPCWTLPKEISLTDHQPGIDGDGLWLFLRPVEATAAPSGQPRLRETDGRHAVLLRFEPGITAPIAIPLRFAADSEAQAVRALKPVPRFTQSWTTEWNIGLTADGLTLTKSSDTAPSVQGFWFIPRADLQPYLDSARAQPPERKGTPTR